jgi:hypothetical protein
MNRLKKILKGFLADPLRLHRYEDERISGRRPEGRITYWVNSGYNTPANNDQKLYWWMFGEDIHLRAMPYRGEAGVSLCPQDDAIEQRIIESMDRSSFRHSLQEVIEKFIRSTAQIVYSYGDAYYEIEYLESENAEVSEFNLHLIYTPSIRKIFGQYFQIITPAAARHAHIKMGIVRIPKKNLLHITSPTKLGGRRGLKRIMRGLLSHGSLPTPPFATESLTTGNKIGFDFDEYDLNRFIYRARLTKEFGWTQRKDTDSPLLEYYWLIRVLRQARAIVIIREHIVNKLNEALKRGVLAEGQKIQIKSPYSLKDVKTAEDKLRQGNVNFNDLVKKFL